MSEKVYVPKCSARARQTQYGELLNVSFDVDALIDFAKAHRNAKGRMNLTLAQRREPGKYGETHSVTLDTFEPARQREIERDIDSLSHPTMPTAPLDDDSDIEF